VSCACLYLSFRGRIFVLLSVWSHSSAKSIIPPGPTPHPCQDAKDRVSLKDRITLLSQLDFEMREVVLILLSPVFGHKFVSFSPESIRYLRVHVVLVFLTHVVVDDFLEPATEHSDLSDLQRGKTVISCLGPLDEVSKVGIGHEIKIV